MFHLCMIFVMSYVTALSAAPATGSPVKIDLPVYEPVQPDSVETTATVLESETTAPIARNDQTVGTGLLAQKLNIASNLLNNNIAASSNNKVATINNGLGIFSQPVTTLEGAILETEGFGSKKLSVKENLQKLVSGFFQPKPIVDTIKEEEKYGNNGDKFYSAGRAIVGGAEGVSNLVNTFLEVPGTLIKKVTRAATEKLNNLGGRLIGLYN